MNFKKFYLQTNINNDNLNNGRNHWITKFTCSFSMVIVYLLFFYNIGTLTFRNKIEIDLFFFQVLKMNTDLAWGILWNDTVLEVIELYMGNVVYICTCYRCLFAQGLYRHSTTPRNFSHVLFWSFQYISFCFNLKLIYNLYWVMGKKINLNWTFLKNLNILQEW